MFSQFMKLMAANPADSSPGLILADWLGEVGAPAESYFRDPANYRAVYTAIFDGYGDGDGDGYGYGYGDGDGNGYGDGDGYGYGDGYGNGYGDGYGYGYGDGYGYGHGDGKFLKMEVLMEGQFVLVCDRAFVLVGVVSPHPSDWQRVIVDNCRTVRRWGTSRGLGQLAQEGPQPNTEMDAEGDGVDVLRSSIMRAIPCNAEVWEASDA